MTFSSLTFLVFFGVVFAAYWTLGRRKPQNVLLLVASYVFYGWWDWRFCGLMLVSSLVDFGLGWALHKTDRPAWRRTWLVVSLVSNLSLLGFFKYYNFFAESFAAAMGSLGWQPGDLTLSIILPVGISFYTFQTLSYTIDIYRRQLTPTTSLIDYLTFVSFFPQLVAGPIERAANLLPQFGVDRRFDAALAADGLRQMLWGLFKKLVIADRLAVLVDPVYTNPHDYSGVHLAFATVCFAFQIYCDFSGYSDIAIGVAKQFGIRLNRNFAYPYFSQGIGEFWRRWHISLSTWFRDYVYFPLGGNRTTPAKRSRNLIATFLVSGVWHGAAWTFVAWGALHGMAVAFLPAGGAKGDEPPGGTRFLPRPGDLLRVWSTLTIVCVLWVFFRAETFADAGQILTSIIREIADPAAYAAAKESLEAIHGAKLTLIVLAVFVGLEWLGRCSEHPLAIAAWPRAARWGVYTIAMWATVLLIPEEAGKEFIYFDF